MPEFIPGLDLAEKYYKELVGPLLQRHYPELKYAAALIDYGSEVLGFDTAMSMDHAWSPRMHLFLLETDLTLAGAIDDMLRRELPTHLEGFPLGTLPSSTEPGVFFMDQETRPGDVAHKVSITSLRTFFKTQLGWDLVEPLQPADWLTFPAQSLRVLTSGRVFCDHNGELAAMRQQLAFYPHDTWLYLLACGWDRIGQEDALLQRAGSVGDELGSAVMGSRLVRDVMTLCFLMEKKYPPYPKWFGSGFKQLDCAAELTPALWQAQIATNWVERARWLGAACEQLARKQNALGVCESQPDTLSSFHGRPYQVIHGENFTAALFAAIQDPVMRRIADAGPLGGIDLISDNSVLRSEPRWRMALKSLYS